MNHTRTNSSRFRSQSRELRPALSDPPDIVPSLAMAATAARAHSERNSRPFRADQHNSRCETQRASGAWAMSHEELRFHKISLPNEASQAAVAVSCFSSRPPRPHTNARAAPTGREMWLMSIRIVDLGLEMRTYECSQCAASQTLLARPKEIKKIESPSIDPT